MKEVLHEDDKLDKDKSKERYRSRSRHRQKGDRYKSGNESDDSEVDICTHDCSKIVGSKSNNAIVRVPNIIKSPSDTTPALKKVERETNVIDKISNFIEGICLDQRSEERSRNRTSTPISSRDYRRVERSDDRCDRSTSQNFSSPSPGEGHRNRNGQNKESPKGQRANAVADQLLLQSEKFRARVEAPKGNYNFADFLMPYDYEQLRTKFVRPEGLAPLDKEILFLRNFDQDDEFFHITSQIEPSMKAKIEKGEFIDLERLLPKDRSMGAKNNGDELNKQLFQLITQGTNGYLEPPIPRTGKINNIEKWDQAFRVYAAIYTRANPERSSEMWQYVYVIHTAAASNPWDNVYYYDMNFRELMATKPWRSWSKNLHSGLEFGI